MAKFPEPPTADDLRAIGPEIHMLRASAPLGRIFFRGGMHPASWDEFRFWGPGQSRYDPHLPNAAGRPTLCPRGVLYAAGAASPGALAVCLAEVFQETRIIDTTDRAPWFVVFKTVRDMSLLDMRGLWPTRAGASAAINSGAKSRARRGARLIYDVWPHLDGIIYSSSMGGNSDAVALFERAASAIPASPLFHRPLTDPSLSSPLLAAAGTINYGIL